MDEVYFVGVLDISIHALREEGDLRPGQRDGCGEPISIHALREEGDSICSTCSSPL